MENKYKSIEEILKDDSYFDPYEIIDAIRNRDSKSLSAKEIDKLLNKSEKYFERKIQSLKNTEKGLYIQRLSELINELNHHLENNFNLLLPPSYVDHSLRYYFFELNKQIFSLLQDEEDYSKNYKVEPDSTVLTNEETALFFMLIRELCFIDPNYPKIKLRKHIVDMTGFGNSSMKTTLSSVESKGVYTISQKNTIPNLENKINLLLTRLLELK